VEALQTVVLIAHLVGMAAIVGGGLEQWRVGERGITKVMLWGARAQIVTGVFLAGLVFGDQDESPNHWKVAVKFLVALGVAALGAHLRGDGAEVLRHALGIAEYHGPRSQMMREIANPTMLHDGSGMGALVGVSSLLQAERDFTGAPAITVEGAEGAHLWADLGQGWTVMRNYIKPYPICRWAHGALECLRALVEEQGVSPDQIEALEVATFAQSAALFPGMPETTSEAQYSLGFALAAYLVHGRLGPAEITGDALRDPRVAEMHARITVREEPRHSARFPEGRWSDVTARLKGGRVIRSGDCNARGGPEAPMPEADIRAKLSVMAGGALSEARIGALWEMRERLLDHDAKFSQLAGLVYPEPDRP